MGQSWILVNLDKREKHEFWKLGERCENFKIHERLSGSTFEVYSAADYIDQEEEQQKVDEERAARSRARGWSRTPVVAKVYRRVEQRQSAFLTKLPVEVISLCVCSMDTLQDKACFALTCQDAWDIARLQIFKDIIPHASWERDRILCIGDYTRIDDIPPNVFNDEELAVLRDIETTKGQPQGAGAITDANIGLPTWVVGRCGRSSAPPPDRHTFIVIYRRKNPEFPLISVHLDSLSVSQQHGAEKWLQMVHNCLKRPASTVIFPRPKWVTQYWHPLSRLPPGQPASDAESSNRDRKIIRMTDFLDARGFVPFSSEVTDVREWLKKHSQQRT